MLHLTNGEEGRKDSRTSCWRCASDLLETVLSNVLCRSFVMMQDLFGIGNLLLNDFQIRLTVPTVD
jgi:hypothetical protein